MYTHNFVKDSTLKGKGNDVPVRNAAACYKKDVLNRDATGGSVRFVPWSPSSQ
jgi:hypothetical protein